MEFYFYNLTSIQIFTSTITVVFEKTRMIWVFPTSSKECSVRIICFILTTLNNEQHLCKCVIFDEYGALAN